MVKLSVAKALKGARIKKTQTIRRNKVNETLIMSLIA